MRQTHPIFKQSSLFHFHPFTLIHRTTIRTTLRRFLSWALVATTASGVVLEPEVTHATRVRHTGAQDAGEAAYSHILTI